MALARKDWIALGLGTGVLLALAALRRRLPSAEETADLPLDTVVKVRGLKHGDGAPMSRSPDDSEIVIIKAKRQDPDGGWTYAGGVYAVFAVLPSGPFRQDQITRVGGAFL